MGVGTVSTDDSWMRVALEQAHLAQSKGEVPVGAVVVKNHQLLAVGHNEPIGACDPSAHAEIRAMRGAASRVHNYRLIGTTLYVTLEPCVMCLGAMIHARIERLVFATRDPRAGAVASAFALSEPGLFNHDLQWDEGVLQAECSSLLTDFFRQKRHAKATS